MDLKLKILQGKNAGQEVAIAGQKFLIGRAEDCHLRPGSDMISRHHCVIVVDQTYVAVRDFGSKNGTYVNSERVVGECELKSGDQLRVGPLEFEISMRQGELGGRKKPPVHSAKEAAERTAAGQPDEVDVAQFLDDPVGETPAVVDSQCVAALDTQSIRLTETEQIALTRMRPVAEQSDPTATHSLAAPSSAALSVEMPSHAARPHAAEPHAPQSHAVQAHAAAEPHAVRAPAAQQPAVQVAAVRHQAHPAHAQPAPVQPASPTTTMVMQSAAPPAAAAVVPPAPMPQANVPKRPLPTTFQMPELEPEAEAPAATDKSGRLDKKKVFGKLPIQPKRPEDSRSAATDALDKLRKRR
jgi:pSer/pThr/pTyr-binding forkhead associated (FHA) protein